jgi:hypothetical protein
MLAGSELQGADDLRGWKHMAVQADGTQAATGRC